MIMSGQSGQAIQDLKAASRAIYTSVAMSIVYSICFIYFLSIFGEYLAWCCVIVLQLSLIGGAGALYFLWDQQKKNVAAMSQDTEANSPEAIEKEKKT